MCFLSFPINLPASSDVPRSYQSARLPQIKTNVSNAGTNGFWTLAPILTTWSQLTWGDNMCKSVLSVKSKKKKHKWDLNDIWKQLLLASDVFVCEDKGPLSTYQTASEEARKATVFVFILGPPFAILQRISTFVSSDRSSLCHCASLQVWHPQLLPFVTQPGNTIVTVTLDRNNRN